MILPFKKNNGMILTSYRKNAYNNLDSMNKISREFQGETKRSISPESVGTITTDVDVHNFLNKGYTTGLLT